MYCRIEMVLVDLVVDDEEVFGHELNELIGFHKLFLEVQLVVVRILHDDVIEQVFLFIKDRLKKSV